MKGGLGLFGYIILFGIILIAGVLWVTDFAPEAFGFTCERDTFDQVNNWVQKMSEPGAGPFEDDFRVGDCVEYITEEEGIKFKSGAKSDFKSFKKPSEFPQGIPITFETGGERILPREQPYPVVTNPNENTIIIFKKKEDAEKELQILISIEKIQGGT